MVFPNLSPSRILRYHPAARGVPRRPAPANGIPSHATPDPDLCNEPSPICWNFDQIGLKTLFLNAALVHSGVGILTVLVTILLGSTVTEALLAVWQLFCGLIGFTALCLQRTNFHIEQPVILGNIWVRIYIAMTGTAGVLAFGTTIHGTFILATISSLSRSLASLPVDYQEPSIDIWFIVLGVSNVVIGVGALIADVILVRKMWTIMRNLQCTPVILQPQIIDGPPQYAAVTNELQPPRYTDVHGNSPVPSDIQNELPPSYEASLTTPAVYIIPMVTDLPKDDKSLPAPS